LPIFAWRCYVPEALLGLARAALSQLSLGRSGRGREPDGQTVTVTYRGYTLSWSPSDASDIQVVRTPGRAEHFPAAAGDRSIRQAKARVASASESATDSCNFGPDSFGLADFGPACQAHDDCYSSSTDRLVCDLLLLRLLREACNVYPAGSSLQLTCYTVASIYFVGVRLFGGFFYTGTGSRL
jgi:hypothetical protein